MSTYRIISYDNGCFGDGGSPMNRGEYESSVEAIERAEQLVDGALAEHFSNAEDAADLMTYFRIYGSEVPYTHGEPEVTFDPYVYAKQRAQLMFAQKVTP